MWVAIPDREHYTLGWVNGSYMGPWVTLPKYPHDIHERPWVHGASNQVTALPTILYYQD